MTAHITSPLIHVEDANGNPHVGAVLYVYNAGTTTLASIYSDAALSVPLSNPLSGSNSSNASGNFPRIFVASGTYKVRAETAAGVLIFQEDDYDTGLTAGAGALSVAAGGTGATTAAAARTSLGAAAQTDVDDLATDIATLSSSLQNLVSVPQGRLTLTSGAAVSVSDISAATAIYYTPYIGHQIPIWDGTQFTLRTFAELTLTLSASHLANTIYDVFVFLDGATTTIGTGPAWNTSTAGSGARGSGAGTTELERKNGLWTNKNAMTMRNGGTTYAVEANKATYVGSIYMDGTNGQISAHVTFGQSRKWGVWNAYNRLPIKVKAGDSTASWDYRTAVIRQQNGTAGNKITVFTGLPEEFISLELEGRVSLTLDAGGTSATGFLGIGWNSTSAYSGKYANFQQSLPASSVTAHEMTAKHIQTPFIGIGNANMLETGAAGANVCNYIGTEAGCVLFAEYNG